jgi:Co/Zn/Cd efflux system component
MAKIKDEQLKKLQEQVNVINQNQLQIGNLEYQKHATLHVLADLQEDLQKFQQELEEEYGKVSVNIATGEYEEAKKDESD